MPKRTDKKSEDKRDAQGRSTEGEPMDTIPAAAPSAGGGDTGAQINAGAPAVARVPQGFDGTVSIRILPANDVSALRPSGCQPRRGATRENKSAVGLPPDLVELLTRSNKSVVAWLTSDAANAQLFLAQPIDALKRAGVELSRSDERALARAHRAVRDVATIPPGTTVAITATAHASGRVGNLKSTPPAHTVTNDSSC